MDTDLIEQDAPQGDPIEIDIESGKETEVPVEAEAPPEKEEDPGLVSLRQQLEEARQRAAEERRRREEADRARREAESVKAQVERAALGSQHDAAASRLDALERDAELAERALAEAIQKGDAAAMAKVNRIMTRIEAERAEAERYRDRVLAAQDRPLVTEGPVRERPSDPVEAAAASLSQRSGEWVRAHSEIVTDPAKAKMAAQAHHRALGEGIQPDTDAYFDFLDRHMGYAAPDPDARGQKADPPSVQRRTVPAAPPASAGGAGQRTVRLTAEERETAEALGMSLQEYAREKLAIEREKGK